MEAIRFAVVKRFNNCVDNTEVNVWVKQKIMQS
jgi:hypothetical protein